MLPPTPLRSGLALTQHRALISTTLKASTSTRSLWNWRRPYDWSSHLDPTYQRFHRIRTLRTKAKLLSKLRRRGKFDWDSNNVGSFFTPKHVRWASRWDGNGWKKRPFSFADDEAVDVTKKDGEDGGYELSQREKVWKEKMEMMRKRIEQDPYEAIFGKRFEPFWGPLVPSWMREEMGLPVWKEREVVKEEPKKETKRTGDSISAARTDKGGESRKPADVAPAENSQTTPGEVEKTEIPKASSYAYASSTTWDSRSNKTKRVEWDSISNETKKYEYDPISNRMVQIEAPEIVKTEAAIEQPKSAKETVVRNITAESKTTPAVSIPVKQPAETRKSIPIPPPLSQPSHSVPIGFAPQPTSVGPLRSTAVAASTTKPSALTSVSDVKPISQDNVQKQDVETLTADEIRANMPKRKTPTLLPVNRDPVKAEATLKAFDLPGLRSIHNPKVPNSEWDQAEMDVILQRELDSFTKKKEKLLKDEQGLFHIEKQKRELRKLEDRVAQVKERMVGRSSTETTTQAASDPTSTTAVSTSTIAALQPSLDRILPTRQATFDQHSMPSTSATTATSTSAVLQPSLDRFLSSKQPFSKRERDETIIEEDPDDSAAHESTGEPLHDVIEVLQASAVPKDWHNQADLLQADRVRRTVEKVEYPDMRTLINASSSPKAEAKAEVCAVARDGEGEGEESKLTAVRRQVRGLVEDADGVLEALRAREEVVKREREIFVEFLRRTKGFEGVSKHE